MEWLYERIEDSNIDRRLLLLLLVILLVVVGSGAGTIIFSPLAAPPDDNEATPTASDTPATQPSPTPAATPGAGGPPASTGTQSPTSDDNPTPETDTPEDTRTDTPEDTPTEVPEEENPTTPSPGLEIGDDEPLLSVANLAPGHSGEGNLTLRNGVNEDGYLTVSAIGITDEENGITDAESSVDSSPHEGNLSSHLEVRLAIRDNAGNEEYLFGTEKGYETLEDLPDETPSTEYLLESGEEVTLVADWRLPSSTGNEVQSDGVSVDLGLTLESTDG